MEASAGEGGVQKATTRKPAARSRKSRKAPGSAEETTVKCPHCDLAFSDESLMISHRDDHEEEYQFECGQCDKLFKELQTLKCHFFSQHTVSGRQGGMEVEAVLPVVEGEFCVKDLNQTLAAVTTSRPSTLERTAVYGESQAGGIRSVKLEVLNIVNNDSFQDGEGAPYKCHECGKLLKSRKTLREHQKRHGQVHKFVCQVSACSKGFKTKQDRDRHEIRVHVPVEQRPNQIACSICGKRIAHQGLIKDHMRTHTGERPFTCELCGKGFRQRNALKDHLQSKMHGGQGMSHRNKKKKKKATPPKKTIRGKVEDESYEEDESESSQDEDMERDSFQSGSAEMIIAQQSQSVAQSLVINQATPPPPPLTSPTRQTRSMMNQQFPHQYHQQQTIPSGNMDGQPPWRIQQQPMSINANNIVYSNHNQQRSMVQEQLVQQQQSQSVMEHPGNVILHMPTLTLHDAFRNVYPTS